MIVKEQDYLEWHGRAGMKWYQHIFGRVQSGAKYASRMSARQIKKQNKRIDKENTNTRNRIVNPRGKNGKAAKVETLTNAELKAALDRINAEQNYMKAVNGLNKEKRESAQAKIETAKQYAKVAKDLFKMYDDYKREKESHPIREGVKNASRDIREGLDMAKTEKQQKKQQKQQKKKK